MTNKYQFDICKSKQVEKHYVHKTDTAIDIETVSIDQ
jgi:hypothetical protein